MQAAALRRSLSPWRPGPSVLAFVAALTLVAAFTRISLLRPYGATDAALEEMEALIPVMVAVVAVAHATLAALATRVPSIPWALLLLAVTGAAFSRVPEVAFEPLYNLLSRVAPAFCNAAPEYCPPAGWSPIVGALVSLSLAPVVVTAQRLRDEARLDAPSTMLTATGAWTALLASCLAASGYVTPHHVMVALGVASLCLATAFVDAIVRRHTLRALLAQGRVSVTMARDTDPDDLRAYTHIEGVVFDYVLRVDAIRVASPYRGMQHGDAIARVPSQAWQLLDALHTHARWRGALLGATVFAALGFA
jgi:hypothetical protein